MTGFSHLTSRYVPLNRANIDTDAIIPKQFLQTTKRTGFGQHLFNDWRYIHGNDTQPNPDFPLNKPVYHDAKILLTQANFGCGSSREHAPWALAQYGFKVIIAPSFADIFYNNAFNSALLPVRLPQEDIDQLFAQAEKNPQTLLSVDLNQQTVSVAHGPVYHFEIDPFRKNCLLKGLDKIALTLHYDKAISAYEKRIPAYQ